MEFSKLERAVIGVILSEPLMGVDVLRQQFAAASVVARDFTGIGFFTRIAVPRSLPPVRLTPELEDQLLYGASGRVKSNPDAGVSFYLRTRGGYLVCLEGLMVTNESWPDEKDIEVVATYIRRQQRDAGPHGS
jgi:hypothetical protein